MTELLICGAIFFIVFTIVILSFFHGSDYGE